jgi:hypothetical protein
MTKRVLIATGGDANFYNFLCEAIGSLEALGLQKEAQIAVLDLGLGDKQVAELNTKGYLVIRPQWTFPVPDRSRTRVELGEGARIVLKDYVPGFSVYVWFDADAWAQTSEFYYTLVAGAERSGAAVVQENGAGYHRPIWEPFTYGRWWYGNLTVGYGPWKAARVSRKRVINSGIMAIAANAPHWEAWARHYSGLVKRLGKRALGQHALNAAIYLEDLPITIVNTRCNWMPTLSPPVWDAERRLLCEPTREATELSVIHLAGSDKRRTYGISERSSHRAIETPLTYEAILALRHKTTTAGAI